MISKPKCTQVCSKCEGKYIGRGKLKNREICICYIQKGYGLVCVNCGKCLPS